MDKKRINELTVTIYLKSGHSMTLNLDPEKYTRPLDVLRKIPLNGFIYVKTRMSNCFRRLESRDITAIEMRPSMCDANYFIDDFIEGSDEEAPFFPTSYQTFDFTGIKV